MTSSTLRSQYCATCNRSEPDFSEYHTGRRMSSLVSVTDRASCRYCSAALSMGVWSVMISEKKSVSDLYPMTRSTTEPLFAAHRWSDNPHKYSVIAGPGSPDSLRFNPLSPAGLLDNFIRRFVRSGPGGSPQPSLRRWGYPHERTPYQAEC
jgi:hypothetical protein